MRRALFSCFPSAYSVADFALFHDPAPTRLVSDALIRTAVKYTVRGYLVLFAFSAVSTSAVTAAMLLLQLPFFAAAAAAAAAFFWWGCFCCCLSLLLLLLRCLFCCRCSCCCSLCQTIWTRGLPTRDSSSITGLVLDKSNP